MVGPLAEYIPDYQNFLRDAPLVAFNLRPDADGVVRFRHDQLASFSTIQILIVDENSIMQSTKNLH